MSNGKSQIKGNLGFILPLSVVGMSVVGIVGLLLFFAWFGSGSTAFAQQEGESEQEGQEHQEGEEHEIHEGDSGPDPRAQGVACMTRILGRVPSGPGDFTPEQQLRIAQECFGGNFGPGPSQAENGQPGSPRLDDTTQCFLRVLGRIPSSRDDISPEERELIAQQCLDQGGNSQGGRFQQSGQHQGPGVPDPKTLACITSVLGRTPQSPGDLNSDERRLVGQQCFGGSGGTRGPGQGGQPRDGGPGDLSDEDLQCITNTIGRLPSGPDDLTDDEKRLLGRACFQGEHGGPGGSPGGSQRGGHGGPQGGELDDATLQCIQENLGRLPLGPHDMTNEEKRLIGQACFGGHGGPGDGDRRGRGPSNITDEELQCITDTIGRLPTGPDDMTDEEKRLVGRACFARDGGPGDLDDATFQCVVDTLGRMPSGPEDMTEDERRLVGRTCFAGQGGPGHGGGDGPNEEQMQCIIDTIGRAPTGPDDLSQEEKRLIGRACFGGGHEGPEDLSDEARQCVIDQLGFLPDGPGNLTDEQMDLVMTACFAGEHPERGGPRGPRELDAETEQCIIGIVGRLPENPGDVSVEQKELIGSQCFANNDRRSGPRGQGQGQGRRNSGRNVLASSGMSPNVRRCITEVVGRVPTASNDLTDSEKRLIGARCFQRSQSRNRGAQSGSRSGTEGTGQPGTSSTQQGQSLAPASTEQQSAEQQSAGQQSAGQQSTGGTSAGTSSPAGTSGQLASSGSQSSAGTSANAQPAASLPQPAIVLNDRQRAIQTIVLEFNSVKEMEHAGVIARLSNVGGSLTAGIKAMSVLNHLLSKGSEITNDQWQDVFEKLGD